MATAVLYPIIHGIGQLLCAYQLHLHFMRIIVNYRNYILILTLSQLYTHTLINQPIAMTTYIHVNYVYVSFTANEHKRFHDSTMPEFEEQLLCTTDNHAFKITFGKNVTYHVTDNCNTTVDTDCLQSIM